MKSTTLRRQCDFGGEFRAAGHSFATTHLHAEKVIGQFNELIIESRKMDNLNTAVRVNPNGHPLQKKEMQHIRVL